MGATTLGSQSGWSGRVARAQRHGCRVQGVAASAATASRRHQTNRGIGSTTDEMVTCPKVLRKDHDAADLGWCRRGVERCGSSAFIAQVGSTSCNSLDRTLGHRGNRTSSTSRRSIPSCVIITNAVPSPLAMPAQHTSCQQDRLCRAVRSRTSCNPRRSRRAASGDPDEECTGMMQYPTQVRLPSMAHAEPP
jgi:hypothetical protein